ncbi:MAG: hypothetical protein DMF53_10905 [Acidobacteria bacterium]|nr:MAG: hypothetical protein DMF53_10905 [Acidobacteriota bacterium]
MNSFQKAGVLIIRFMGAIIAAVGLLGPLYAAFTKAIGKHVPDYPDERWIGSIVWAVGGIVLVFAAKPLGRLLGRGLE